MIRYAELFQKSNVMERILPRQIESGSQLLEMYPDLLMDTSSQKNPDVRGSKEDEYNLADLAAINKVSTPVRRKSCRETTSPFTICLTGAANSGAPFSA